jgi:hypothetical protein
MFSMFDRRLLIEYLLMVGVPLLLLLGVLQRGRGLSAPSSVDGSWRLEVDGSPGSTSPCEQTLDALDGSVIEITQSGNYLDALAGNGEETTALRGREEGTSLWLESVRRQDSVLNGEMLRLTGEVMNVSGSRIIRGTVLMPRQVDCAPRGFQAAGLPGSDGKAEQGEQ